MPTHSNRPKPSSIYTIGSGTSIVTYITKDKAWMAADSKQVNLDNITGETTIEYLSKLYKTDKSIYGFTGHAVANKEDWMNPIFLQTFENAKGDQKTKLMGFGNAIGGKIYQILDNFNTTHPDRVKQFIGKEFVSASIVTTHPAFAADFVIWDILPDPINQFKVAIRTVPYEYGIPVVKGSNRTITKNYKNHSDTYFQKEPDFVKDLTDLINLEAKANEMYVGGKVDVVYLDLKGSKSLTNNIH